MAKDIKENLFADVQNIVESVRQYAYSAVNVALVQRNWLIGKRIAEEELKGENRAEYGMEIIKDLSKFLTKHYDKEFDFSTLYKFVRFYKAFPNILDSVSTKSLLLSWTHYRILLRVDNDAARNWYCCTIFNFGEKRPNICSKIQVVSAYERRTPCRN